MADYTQLTHQEVNGLAAQYGLTDIIDITPMQGGQANSSFKIKTEKEIFILSVCDEKNTSEIDHLIRLLLYLNQQDFPTSKALLTRKKEFQLMHDHKPVYIKKFIPGDVIQELTPIMLLQVGETLAKLHAIAPPDFLAPLFPYGIESFDGVIKKNMDHPYLPWLIQKKAYIETHMDTSMAKGFIHGDIYWDNLLFDKENLTAILDFEEACFYYKLYDIGMTAVGCCTNKGTFDLKKISFLLKGYQPVCPIKNTEKQQLKIFIEYAAVAGSFWRFRQYNIKLAGHDKADTYTELAALADQVHDMETADFMQIF